MKNIKYKGFKTNMLTKLLGMFALHNIIHTILTINTLYKSKDKTIFRTFFS